MVQIDMDMPKCCADCDIETYEENYNGDPTFHYCPMVYKGYTNEIRDRGRLNDCPVKEAKRGKWIPLFNGEYTGGAYWFECSECKMVVSGGLQSGNRFCKGCGAKMEDGK